MDKKKFLFLNVLPILFIMAIIFIASSQTSDQQDISPILDRVSDESSLRELGGTVMERINQLVERMVLFTKSNLTLAFTAVFLFASLMAVVLFRFFSSAEPRGKKILKSFIYTTFFLLFLFVMLFTVYSGPMIELIRSTVSFDHLRRVLNFVDFTYAGTQVNVHYWGVEGLLTFLLRKFAHFFLFGLLGFFFFLALFKLNRRSVASFVITVIFVIAYAALDEYRQSFIPSRSALVEDVILDTAGGIFGASMAMFKTSISNWFRRMI